MTSIDLPTRETNHFDSWLSATAVAAAAVGLGYALQFSNGALEPHALAWLTFAIAFTVLAAANLRIAALEHLGDHLPMLVIGVGLGLQTALHLTSAPGIYLRSQPGSFIEHHYGIAAAAILAGAGLSKSPWLGRLTVPLLLFTHFLLGLWLLRESPSPIIDVFTWHHEAFSAMGHGVNPYSISMPNIYGHTQWYAPGLADTSRVNVGYPYPPLSLLLAAPGHLLAGDYRYSNLVAITAAGGLMAYARPGRFASSIAALFLLTPRGFFVLEQGWTESAVVFILAATVFLGCRAPRFLPYALGLLFAVKQYFILTAPLALFLIAPPWSFRAIVRFYAKAVAVALAFTLPAFLWDPGGFIRSVIVFQGLQPFRAEALSYLAWTARDGVPIYPLWLSFAAILPALGLAFWRSARTPAGYALATSLLFLMFFGFAKQAFCNYYFMIVGALCCAGAAMAPSVNGSHIGLTSTPPPEDRPYA